LKAISQRGRAEWLKRSDVRMALGEAYGDLEQYEEAAANFAAALDTGELDSKTTIKAVEQLSNFEARLAKTQKKPDGIQKAIDRLKALQTVAPTAERFSLIGSAYKRLADLAPDAAVLRDRLNDAANAYAEAHAHNEKRGTFEHYPVVNWLALKVVLGAPPHDALTLLEKSETSARERFARSRDTIDAVFDAVASADAAVVRALVTSTFATAGDERNKAIDRIVASYRDLFRRVQATRGQKGSAMGQLETLESLMRKLSAGAAPEPDNITADALATIRSRVVA
jgi:tetratricopeptide (TPR) repeat protein